MKVCMGLVAIVLIALSFPCLLMAQGQLAITKFQFVAVDCHKTNCESRKVHGKLTVEFADKSKQVVQGNNVIFGKSKDEDPKIGSSRKVAGWLVGEHVAPSGNSFYTGTNLVLIQNGKLRKPITGQRFFIEKWLFWDNDKEVALLSRAAHGPATVELISIQTGKTLQKMDDFAVDKKSPKWAQQLTASN